VGRTADLETLIELIGRRASGDFPRNTEREVRRLLVTDRNLAGKSLRELNLVEKHGVVITRISRLGLTFVPGPATVIEPHDFLTTVGFEDNLHRFSEFVGHRETQVDATDLLSLSVGIAGGVLLGMIPFALPGSEAITLGMAGGPLIVGLLLGHFGRVGGIVGHIPRPTRLLLQELGLVLFLADAGIKGGGGLVETVSQYGLSVFLMGLAITLLPMLIVLVFSRKLLNLTPLQTLGGICGGMTSTPALGAITARTDAQTPIISYATAYPVALVIMTLLAKVLVALLS
jgi:putative transport protein